MRYNQLIMASINFKGKTAVWNHHLSVPYHTLEKDKKNSLEGKNDTDNLIIEGDNLLALKALLPKYQGKVKCIYIDPPYNTGNEGWVYNDKVNNPVIKNWIGEVVGKEGEDLVRHDKWLAMMTPRLKLLREMLSDDGVIFVSIDSNEVHTLRMLLGEVFTETNFVAELPVVMNLKGNHDAFGFSDTHEFCLVFAKDKELLKLGQFDIDDEDMDNWEEDEYGLFKRADTLRRTGQDASRERRPKGWFPVFIDANHLVYVTNDDKPRDKRDYTLWPINEEGEELSWSWGKNKINNENYNLTVIEGRNGLNVYKKQRPQLGDLPTKKPKSLWYKPEYSTSTATTQLQKLFGKKLFDGPKPVPFIKDIIRIATEKDSIVLDSFAGSGTTAQAIAELNAEDGGSRKFILVQIPEEVKKDRPAYKEGYRWVHEITRDRVKKVIERDKFDVGFTYYTLGPDIDGKKILTGKNMPTWDVMAKYVHFLATGKPIDEVTMAKKTWEIAATKKGTGVYLIYIDTLDELKKLAITRDWLEAVKDKAGKKIVYAPACFLDKEILDEYNISFVQVPFNLFTRK